jgi:hypothetical protein
MCVVNGSPHLCSVMLYQRSTRQWVRCPALQTPRVHAAMASFAGHVYVMVRMRWPPFVLPAAPDVPTERKRARTLRQLSPGDSLLQKQTLLCSTLEDSNSGSRPHMDCATACVVVFAAGSSH